MRVLCIAVLGCACATLASCQLDPHPAGGDADGDGEVDVGEVPPDVEPDADADESSDEADGDGDADVGGDADGDADAGPICGNGIVESGEDCDSDSPRSCSTFCDSTGSQACVGCHWEGTCTPPAESCNGADDNCDGSTDETFACVRGATGVACTNTCGVAGTTTCSATCTLGACCAASEVCGNGCDDDCDTSTDEGCGATVGTPCTGDAACTGGGLVCNENWGICVVASCTGQPNFKPCETVTTSDRSYDICVDGSCVSPGCGDATCNAPGPNWTLADTSQRSCYNASATIACPGTPGTTDCETTAFCGQDAQYGWDVAHTAAERFTRTVPVADQPVVHDNVTGLDWQGCAYGMTGDASSCSGTASRRAWSSALADCDSLSWGGFSDWRLPDEFELQSIVDYGRSSAPSINTTFFPGTPSDYFWSSSSSAGTVSYAWCAVFSAGVVNSSGKTNTLHVRCVRHGP